MDIRIKEVQKTNFGSWEVRIEKSNEGDLIGFMTTKNISRLLTALDLKAPGIQMGLEDPKKLVGVSSKKSDLELKIYNQFIKLSVSFPARGFFQPSKVPPPLGKILLVGVEMYDHIGTIAALVLQSPKSKELYTYFINSTQKINEVFGIGITKLLVHATDTKYKVKEVKVNEDDKTKELFITLTVSMPTPPALN